MNYIPLADCKHGWLYHLRSRNLSFGVFRSDTNGFVGIRFKFGSEFLFQEFHADTGAPHGTVYPLTELERCPVTDLREDLGTVCARCEKPYHFDHPKNGWRHDSDEDRVSCEAIVFGPSKEIVTASPIGQANKKLSDYLDDARSRFKHLLQRNPS